MQPTDVHKESVQKVPTGLFVTWKKSSVLLRIVQNILRKQFKTIAETGSRVDDDTCEIVLRAVEPSGANFSASKDLLENYLDMIKEPKHHSLVTQAIKESEPDLSVQKQPEVIDLGDEDEDMSCIVLDHSVNSSVSVVDLDSSMTPGVDRVGRTEEENTDSLRRNMAICKEEVIVLDPFNCKQHSPPGSVLRDSNRQELKRKKQIEKKEIEVVEILDDDVIVLEDSFSEPNCNEPSRIGSSFGDMKITVKGDKRSFSREPYPNVVDLSESKINKEPFTKMKRMETSDFFCDSQSFIPLNPPKKVRKLEDSEVDHTKEPEIIIVKTVANSISTNNSSIQSSSSTPKKPSKFSYKRPAHLIVPLIKSSSSEIPKADTAANIYNPNADQTEKRTGFRPVVIDGNNVAVSHGKGQFSVKGIQICINFFEKRGHRHIKAFVPHYRINQETFDSLKKMEQQGTVVMTPSRKVEGKTVASYDDRYIVQYASEVGGVIVSTDNYRDLLHENSSWKDTIDNRLLMFTWVDDLLMFPQDPLGRRGPSLEDFLKFPE